MARPRKRGLAYFPLDTDLFGDRKIQRLLKKYGNDGVMTYLAVLCETYSFYDNAYASTINAQGVIRDRYTYDQYTYETTATLLGQLGYTLRKNDRLSYNIMYINNTEDSYITRDSEQTLEIDDKTIEVIPAWKWLLIL